MQFLNCYDIASGVNSCGGNNIEHRVSKIDTLAGIAIKYGVEVADIRRLNGLATDLQMFAHRTLLIPLPGRHPPSPGLSNGSASPCEDNNKMETPPLLEPIMAMRFKSPQMKISPAMSKLQKYYGLSSQTDKSGAEGTEMAVYGASAQSSSEEAAILEPHCSSHRRSGGEDGAAMTAQPLLKEGHGPSHFLPVVTTATGLAMRSKTTAARTSPAREVDPAVADEPPSGVRRSTSTPNLQEQENGGGSLNVWPPSRWSLKPDLQVLSSTAAIAVPIFDGLPKPISAWRSKAAMD